MLSFYILYPLCVSSVCFCQKNFFFWEVFFFFFCSIYIQLERERKKCFHLRDTGTTTADSTWMERGGDFKGQPFTTSGLLKASSLCLLGLIGSSRQGWDHFLSVFHADVGDPPSSSKMSHDCYYYQVDDQGLIKKISMM